MYYRPYELFSKLNSFLLCMCIQVRIGLCISCVDSLSEQLFNNQQKNQYRTQYFISDLTSNYNISDNYSLVCAQIISGFNFEGAYSFTEHLKSLEQSMS